MNSSEACLLGTLSPEAPVVSPQQRLCQDLPAARGWGRAGTTSGAKNRVHACLGKHTFESYLSPKRPRWVNRGPGLRQASPLLASVPSHSAPKEAAEAAKANSSCRPASGHCCMASNAAGRPPGSPPPDRHRPGAAPEVTQLGPKGREWGAVGPKHGAAEVQESFTGEAAYICTNPETSWCPATGDPGSLQSPYNSYSQRMLSDMGTKENSRPLCSHPFYCPSCRTASHKDGCHPALQLRETTAHSG